MAYTGTLEWTKDMSPEVAVFGSFAWIFVAGAVLTLFYKIFGSDE